MLFLIIEILETILGLGTGSGSGYQSLDILKQVAEVLEATYGLIF